MYQPKIAVTTLSVILGVCLPAWSATKVFQGTGNNDDWNNPNLWFPVGVPSGTDDVVLAGPVTASLATGSSEFIGSLSVRVGGVVKTGGNNLTVNISDQSGLTTIDGAIGLSTILVQPGALSGPGLD